MSKKKKSQSQFKSELHYISHLPMEVLAERIGKLENKYRPLMIRQISEDEIGFIWKNHVRGAYVNTELFGSLMRWNGTYTRLDVDSRSADIWGWMDVAMQFFAVISLVIALTPCFWLFGAFLEAGDFALVLLVGFIGLAFGTLLILSVNRFANIDIFRGLRYRAMRDTDSMMQAIADQLTAGQAEEEALEFDGSETSLANLLKSEKYKQFRMNADGELEES